MERVETLIIGGGPAGLAVGGCLRRLEREFVIIERAPKVGAAWRGHYERLHLHTVKEYSALPHRPFPDDFPRYVPRARFVEYLEDYVRAFDLGRSLALGEEVRRATPVEGGWRVESSSRVREARFLVVATGYNNEPVRPHLPGEERFAGEVAHSCDYRSGASYRDRRVLVIGFGNTGAEIAIDLVEAGAAAVDVCLRGPVHVIKRELFGTPAQVLAIRTERLPRRLRDVGFRALVRLAVGDLRRWGIRRPKTGIVADIDSRGRIPVIDVGAIDLIKAGRIGVRPAIEQLTEAGARFVDGAAADYDAIILATGYRPRLERFLDRAEEVLDERGLPRRLGEETELPGLFFVGFRNPSTGMLREIDREARRVAAAIASRSEAGRVPEQTASSSV